MRLNQKRVLLPVVGGLMTAVILSGCSGAASNDAESVTFVGWGGSGQEAISEAWFKPFAEQNGVSVVEDNPIEWQKIQLMADNGNVTWDVAQYGPLPGGLDENPSLEEIDCSIVACEEFEDSDFPIYKQAVPFITFSYTVAYNTDVYSGGDHPNGYADFFDNETFPGPRSISSVNANGWQGFIEAALLFDGVDREDLYPLDVERALGVMDQIKDDLIVASDDSQCINDVAAGEAVMGTCYNGRTAIAQKEGMPVDIGWGQQIVMSDYLMIVKGSPNLEAAQELIAHSVSKENSGKLADFIAYGSPNPMAEIPADGEWSDFVPEENYLEGEQAPIFPDSDWWVENQSSVVEQISEWLQS